MVNVVMNEDDISFLRDLVPDRVENDDTLTVPWVVLKGNGPDTVTGARWEYRHTPYSDTTNNWRPSYLDFYTLTSISDARNAIGSGQIQLAQQNWDASRVEQAYIHNIDIDKIAQTIKAYNIDLFETGFYYVWSNSTASNRDLFEWARAPLGKNKPFAIAHEAFNPDFLGWGEAGMQLSQCAVDRINPGSSFLIDCWLYHMFPHCPDGENCFTNDVTVLGTETIIPSPYCTERWFINDYEETQDCIGSISLTPALFQECLVLAKENKIPITCP